MKSWKIHGRRKPYTIIGIRRLPCVRCGKPAHATWAACADNRILRPLCLDCDIALNVLVLQWMGFDDWEQKIIKYCKEQGVEYYENIDHIGE
jgi:hypothetical protein